MSDIDAWQHKSPRQLLGGDVVDTPIMVKEIEHRAYRQVIGSWEREYLLFNV